jgi:hypothetical protein
VIDWLVTGRGTSGSWAVRGEQLGRAIGASVVPAALDVAGYRAAILVKRPSPGLVERLHRASVPIVYDIVDAYPQPIGLEWDKAQCMRWLRAQVADIRPVALVAATAAMAEDCKEFGLPVLWLPHHYRPGMVANPGYGDVRKVGYEGGEHYLGRWLPLLERECHERGWRFILNPPSLSCLDIVVALRDASGYAAKEWKSGVKLANAIGSGTPAIIGNEAGCVEFAPSSVRSVDTAEQLKCEFDRLSQRSERDVMIRQFAEAAPSLSLGSISTRYAEWLRGLSI